MTTYYPTQGSAYAVQPQQPVVYAASNAGYNAGFAPTAGTYLGQSPEVLVVPSQGSHHSHHSHHSHSGSHHGHYGRHQSSHGQTVIAPVVAAPVVMQPGHSGHGGYASGYYRLSFRERLRRFFGLAPRGPFKYRNNKGTWGFMGYSRRQRYSDPRTGAEVDRKGRPVYRV